MFKKLLTKFHTASPAVKASMAMLFANIILKGFSFLSGPIFTRLMPTEQYGLVSTFTSWQSLLSVFFTLNLSQGVYNNGMLDYKDHRNEFQFSLYAITSIITISLFIVFCCFTDQIVLILELPVQYIVIMFIYFLFIPAYQFWVGRQRYEYKYKALVCITISIAFFSLGFGIIAVLLSDVSNVAMTRIITMEGVNIVVGIFFSILLAVRAKFKIRLEYCKYALKFNIPLIPHYLSMYVLSSSDRIMISRMVNHTATAIYSVAYTVASVISIVWQSIESSLSPWIYEKLSTNNKQSVRSLTTKSIMLFAFLCLFCTLFAPEIMTILAPKEYSLGIYVIPPVAAGVYFTAIYSLYMRIELFYKQTNFAAVATGVAALSNIILNYVCITIFGFVAAAYTTLTCYGMLSLLHYINIKKKGYSDIFNNKMILSISFVVIILSAAISLLYSCSIIRYFVICVIIISAIYKHNMIFDIARFHE